MIKQIAVFLENREGRVSECCKALKDAGVNLCSMSIADSKEFGILRIHTDNNELAHVTLKKAGFLSTMVDLVAIEVPDKPGALADILIQLCDGGVNIDYMYSFANASGHAQIGFKTETPEKAIVILEKLGVKMI